MTSGSVAGRGLGLECSAARDRALARWYTGALVYTFVVVLFGAVVRITGSGAGCGQHWPTCRGEIAPLPQSLATAIELGHRVTSGLSFLVVIGLAAVAFRRLPQGHLARRFAALSAAFMVVEVVIGALLVLRRLVEHDDSVERAVVGAAHLVNTSLLMGSLLVSILAVSGDFWPKPSLPRRALAAAALGAATILAVCVSGAVTALGDTVYPVAPATPLTDRVFAEHGSTLHFLVRLRALHPLLAVLSTAALLGLVPVLVRAAGSARAVFFGRAVASLLVGQAFAGLLNILLSAPGWLQILHLALASAVWLAWVLLSSAALSASPLEEPGATTARAALG